MILKLAAEDFAGCYGVVIFEEDYYIEIDHSDLPKELMNELKEWYLDYYKYTGMIRKELVKHEEDIDKLDKKGIQILIDIYKLNLFEGIKKYTYYSRGKDKQILVLDGISKI